MLTVHPVREHIPIYLAAIGPKNLELTGEIADGWLAIFFDARARRPSARRTSRAGRAKVAQGPGRLRRRADRPGRARRRPRGVRRTGARLRRAVRRRHGQPGAELLQPARRPDGVRATRPTRCRSRFLARDYAGAAAAVPFEFIDRTVADRAAGPGARTGWRRTPRPGVTTLTVATYAGTLDERLATLRTMAEVLDESGLGD